MAENIIPDCIRDVLDYDPDSGQFTWLVARGKAALGSIAGHHHSSGYIRITHKGRQYSGHRLAWFFVHGEQPDVIDHINHNTTDNRIANLRNVDNAHNQLNRKGVTGIHWSYSASKGRWYVVSTYRMRHLYRGNNITTAWFRRIMAERADHPLALPPTHKYL